MALNDFINKCNEVLHCRHCGQFITGGFSYYGGGMTSEDALKRHESECEENPQTEAGKLKSFMLKCQTTAKVFDCLNCKQFQKGCRGTENR